MLLPLKHAESTLAKCFHKAAHESSRTKRLMKLLLTKHFSSKSLRENAYSQLTQALTVSLRYARKKARWTLPETVLLGRLPDLEE